VHRALLVACLLHSALLFAGRGASADCADQAGVALRVEREVQEALAAGDYPRIAALRQELRAAQDCPPSEATRSGAESEGAEAEPRSGASPRVGEGEPASGAEAGATGSDKKQKRYENAARAADRKTQDRWAKYIPEAKKQKAAADLVTFLPDAEYEKRVKERFGEKTKVEDVFGWYDGDTDEIVMPMRRRDLEGTLVHESLHYYSHDDFYTLSDKVENDYGVVGLKEGAAEFFTQRTVTTKIKSYRDETRVVRRLVRDVGAGTVAKAFFQGDSAAIEKIDKWFNSHY
jgi:hypothetical protein